MLFGTSFCNFFLPEKCDVGVSDLLIQFPVIGLRFVLYPSPSRIKWAITEGGNMQGHTCMWIFFIVFVHNIMS